MVLQDTASVEYLLKRKFGHVVRSSIRSTSQLGSITKRPSDLERERQITKYRGQLACLNEDELEKLVQKEKALEQHAFQIKMQADEAARPFNQSWSKLDHNHWSKISFWTLDEAVAISLNKDPRKVKWESLKSLTNVSPFAAKYEAKLMLVERAKKMGQLWAETSPSTFLMWAKRTGFDFPVELMEAVQALGVQVADWKSRYEEQLKLTECLRAEIQTLNEHSIATSKESIEFLDRMRTGQREIDKARSDQMDMLEHKLAVASQKIKDLEAQQQPKAAHSNELSPRVKDTLLKMIIGMATDAYGFVPPPARSPFPKELSDILALLGLEVTDETIRKYLKEATQLLPSSIGE